MTDIRLSQSFEDESVFARDIEGQLIRVVAATAADYAKTVTLQIDGKPVTVKQAVPSSDSQGNVVVDSEGHSVPRATTIYDAATQLFVKKPGDQNPIPILCHQEHMRPVAVCRICVVEVSKVKRGQRRRERKLLPACQHRVEEGMEVQTIDSPDPGARSRIRSAVGMLTELLLADQPSPTEAVGQTKGHPNDLQQLAARLGIESTRFSPRPLDRGRDNSSFVIAVDHNACILCDRCVRACDDVKHNHVIGRTGKGYTARIGFDLDTEMGSSTCVSCGECMISCPTDALTFRGLPREVEEHPRPRGTFEISATELKQIPLFSGIPLKFLQWNSGAVTLRRLKQGEVLFQEGDYGSTAFILLSGQYEVSIRTPFSHVESHRPTGLRGLFGFISNRLSHDTASDAQQYIPVDGGAPLPYGKPVAIRTADDVILGEMTCMNHYPRSATVVVKESGEALEIRRNVLYALQRNSVARQILDRVYRERVLGDHLRTLSLFKDLSDAERRLCAQFLKHKVDLIRVDPGQTIFRQGEPADHFYMVRLGFVKVTQNYPGGERVLDYLGPGRHFGEIGLLSALAKFSLEGVPAGYQGMRTATCAALDDVELVRIRGEHFRELVNSLPTFRDKILQQSKELLAKDEAARGQVDQSLEEFLDQGLFNAQKLLVLDLEACTRCDECTRACADTHDGVTRLIREGLRFDKYLIASSCRSCLDPYCLVGCPVDAIHRQGSLEIVIENHCIGCGLCASNCPYGNINMHAKPEERSDPRNPGRTATVLQQKATTCDLCRNVVGPNQDPSCVYACPHNAAFRKSGRELLTLVRRT